MVRTNNKLYGRSEDQQPICKLGPGGEFVSVFSAMAERRSSEPATGLGRVILALAEFMGAVVSPVYAVEASLLKESKNGENNNINHNLELDNGITGSKNRSTDNTKTNAAVKGAGKFPEKQMLFANDWGVGGKNGNKPHYNVRTSRRVAKKKIAFSKGWESSLFEVDSSRTSVA